MPTQNANLPISGIKREEVVLDIARNGFLALDLAGQSRLGDWRREIFVATAAKRWKTSTTASTVWRRWLPCLAAQSFRSHPLPSGGKRQLLPPSGDGGYPA